ncbi:hypothetical protein D3C75_415220 [compost metagenome]
MGATRTPADLDAPKIEGENNMKKLEGGLWESKFILPGHRVRMERDAREDQRREKSVLDQQELEEIDRALFTV